MFKTVIVVLAVAVQLLEVPVTVYVVVVDGVKDTPLLMPPVQE